MIIRFKSAIRTLLLLPKNSFARGVSVIVGGTASAQILLVLVMPILTRLYTPEDFGLLAVYTSLLALIGVISSLRYELAIPLPENDIAAANVAALSLLLVVVSTLLTTIFLLILGTSIAELLGAPMFTNYLWLLPVGVFLSGSYTVFNYWSVRTKRFGAIARTKLTQAITSLVIQLATFKLGGIGLLLGQVAGQSAGTTNLARLALAMTAFKQFSWVGIKEVAVRYKRFPIFSTWSGFANAAGAQLPPIMFAALFSPVAAGFYALAYRVTALPISLVGSALQSVFLSTAAEAHRNNQLGDKVKGLLDNSIQLAIIPTAILVLTGPDLFTLVFGAQWRQAGVMVQWIAPWLLMQFCTGPLTIVNAVAEKQHLGLIMQMQLLAVRIVMLIIGAYYGDITFTIMLFSFGSTVSYFIFLWVILSTVGLSIIVFIKSLMRAIGVVLIIILPILVLPGFMLDWKEFAVVSVATITLITIRFFLLARHQY